MPDSRSLLIVYNLDSGVLQSLHEYSGGGPSASQKEACHLSAMTHSPVGVKKEWKRFLKGLPYPARSLDRDEFSREFGPRQVTFPAVIFRNGPELQVIVTADELRRCPELGDLIALLEERLPKA